jgi:hypothetical protein
MFRRRLAPGFAVLLVTLTALCAAGRGMAAALPGDDEKECPDFVPHVLLDAVANSVSKPVINSILAIAPLPVQTARIFCAWFNSEAAAQMSRSDTLWFQAGYGGLPGDLGSETPAFPKWDSPNPSLFRVQPSDTSQAPPYSNPFAPGTGTGR